MLNIRETYAQMGKLSNNLENHGEEEVTAFDIPISGIALTGEEFNALLEDPYADRWLFTDKADLRESNVTRFKPLELIDTFDDALVQMTINEQQFKFAGARIKGVTFEARRGGDVMLSFDVRVRPENDKEILALIGFQNREIKIDVQDAKIAVKGGRKQQELPLATAGENEQREPTHPEELFEKPKRKRAKKNGSGATAH